MSKRPFVRFAIAAACVFALIVGFNFIVNSFGVWTPYFGRNFLKEKTARINSVRLVKAYDLLRGCPDHVVTGMSSVVWGIDPAQYPLPARRLYNGGLVGSSMIEQYSYVMSFLDQCPNIKRVYIDVNFESFHMLRINARDFTTERLGRSVPTLGDWVFTTFSRSAIKASIETIAYHYDGSIVRRVYDRGDGYHRVPEASSEVYYNNIMLYLKAPLKTNWWLDDKQLEYFRDLVVTLRKRGVEVIPYFAPIHTSFHYMRRYDANVSGGSARLQDELRRYVAQTTDFWDFSMYNDLTGEDITQLKYFVDQIHYRARTGRHVMEILNGIRDPKLPANFGVRVTRDSVDEHLKSFSAGVDQWALRYPELARQIREVYERVDYWASDRPHAVSPLRNMPTASP